MKWYKAGELNRFEQPVGKQYSFGKGSENESETEKLKAENRYLKQQIKVLKSTKSWKGSSLGSSRRTHREIQKCMPVKEICWHFGLARSTYYHWRRKNQEEIVKQEVERKIGVLCRDHNFRYGYHKIQPY